MSDFANFGRDFTNKANATRAAMSSRLPREVGDMLLEGFKDSFEMQRFNDNGSPSWQNVKRRDPGSSWYGFDYKKDEKGKKGRFSPAATTRSVLFGSGSSNLRDSLFLARASRGTVVIASDLVYAEVHNEGKSAKVFGGKSFTMPERKFMGNSEKLLNRTKKIYDYFLKRILP